MVVIHSIEYYLPNGQADLSYDQVQGQNLGLNPFLWLPAECANFYILERLNHELFPWNGDTRIPREMFPREFGSDSRLERLAYAVQVELRDLETMLAKELSQYLVMSIGGELRWATRKAATTRDELFDCEHSCGEGDCCGHDCCSEDFACCSHNCSTSCCAHTCDGDLCVLPLGCACKCDHAHVGLHPGSGYTRCQRGWEGCHVDGCCEHKHNDCHQECCGHSCSNEDFDCCTHSCGTDCSGERYTPEGVLTEFFETTQASSNGRSGAWEVWPKFVEKHGPDVLLAAAEVFSDYSWEQGYGNKAWGSAARFTYAYIVGDMSKRTFIDRCWTLQHNSGCIFNKFYTVGDGGRELIRVLNNQHQNAYDRLVQFASVPVQQLWRTYQHIVNKGLVTL